MESERRTGKRSKPFLILRWSLALLFPIVSFFVLSFLVGLVAVFLADSPVTGPISVPSQCKIVSSSVDLRSSKVCELGLFNYKAKHVFYPFEKSKFRCRYDYYWASIFKVEYRDLSSGVTQLAFAEAPNEALPLYCRPNFGAAWLNKDKFKVNETYNCWYTYGISKVSLHGDGFFSCQAKDPSTFEMIKRYVFLSVKIIQSWVLSKDKSKYWRWEMVAGVITGFSTSLISISFVMLLQQIKYSLPGFAAVRNVLRALRRIPFSRTCFLVVYLSVVGWLALQHGRRLGLFQIFTAFNN